MDPIIGAAAIMAATQVIGGLLGAAAQSRSQKRAAYSNIYGQQIASQQAALEQQAKSETASLSNLVDAYRSALIG